VALGDLPTSCTALTRSSGRYVFEQAPAGLVLSALRVRRGSGQGGCRCSGGFSRLRRRTRPRSWLRCKSRLRPPPPLKVRQELESTSIPRSDPSEIQVDLGESSRSTSKIAVSRSLSSTYYEILGPVLPGIHRLHPRMRLAVTTLASHTSRFVVRPGAESLPIDVSGGIPAPLSNTYPVLGAIRGATPSKRTGGHRSHSSVVPARPPALSPPTSQSKGPGRSSTGHSWQTLPIRCLPHQHYPIPAGEPPTKQPPGALFPQLGDAACLPPPQASYRI